MPNPTIITDYEAVRRINQSPGRFVAFVGAGVSAEAEVWMADRICRDIKERFTQMMTAQEADEWAEKNLEWKDTTRRYAVCLRKYGNKADRVEYFRNLLRYKGPCFAHHALAMLCARGVLKRTILTTNFDKLIETAFAQQGLQECQPIRLADEADYWQDAEDRCYTLKLHGDYDTYNVANTMDETIEIPPELHAKVQTIAQNSGLLVMGVAANEKSVHALFDHMSTRIGKPDRLLAHGVLWGVYAGAARPERVDEEVCRKAVLGALPTSVGRDAIEMMERTGKRDEGWCMFPVWGSGNFLFECIKARKEVDLTAMARLYLDHEMRLRHVFARAGLTAKAIEHHLGVLRSKRQPEPLEFGADNEHTFTATAPGTNLRIHLLYGDITKRRMMGLVSDGIRRAVVSPEDTLISAGGGVALLLLKKAGSTAILNELAKLQPIEHGSVAVTSGGRLPAEYIFHAAAICIQAEDGAYLASQAKVSQTIGNVAALCDAMDVRCVWTPLLAAGVAGLGAEQSLRGILAGIKNWKPRQETDFSIVAFREKDIPRAAAAGLVTELLGANWKIEYAA